MNIYGINQWAGGKNKLEFGKVKIYRDGQGIFKEKYENLLYFRTMNASSKKWGVDTDASVDGRSYTGWISDTVQGPHWLQADLGSDYMVYGWKVGHAGYNGEDTLLNTRDFKLQVSEDGTNWTDADTVLANTDSITERMLKKGVKARYLRLYITEPVQAEIKEKIARIMEFQVYGLPYSEALEKENVQKEEKDNKKAGTTKIAPVIIVAACILVIAALVLVFAYKSKNKNQII